MKKSLVILAIAAVVGSAALSQAAVRYTSLGTVVTRSEQYYVGFGDEQSWQNYNNRGAVGSGGGSAYGQGWDWQGTAGPSSESIIRIDRSELQSVIDSKGGVNAFSATFLIPERSATSGAPDIVIGLFRADGINWGDNGATNTPKCNAMAYDAVNGNIKWSPMTGGTSYNTFEEMVKGENMPFAHYSTFARSQVFLGSSTEGGTDGNRNMTLQVQIPASLVLQYLNDPTWTGFFFSNAADPATSLILGYGGAQWSGGVGGQSILITPEPATMILLAMGGLALIRRRHA